MILLCFIRKLPELPNLHRNLETKKKKQKLYITSWKLTLKPNCVIEVTYTYVTYSCFAASVVAMLEGVNTIGPPFRTPHRHADLLSLGRHSPTHAHSCVKDVFSDEVRGMLALFERPSPDDVWKRLLQVFCRCLMHMCWLHLQINVLVCMGLFDIKIRVCVTAWSL
jgi:hypothetical protein